MVRVVTAVQQIVTSDKGKIVAITTIVLNLMKKKWPL
jgi:hypothetical protein